MFLDGLKEYCKSNSLDCEFVEESNGHIKFKCGDEIVAKRLKEAFQSVYGYVIDNFKESCHASIEQGVGCVYFVFQNAYTLLRYMLYKTATSLVCVRQVGTDNKFITIGADIRGLDAVMMTINGFPLDYCMLNIEDGMIVIDLPLWCYNSVRVLKKQGKELSHERHVIMSIDEDDDKIYCEVKPDVVEGFYKYRIDKIDYLFDGVYRFDYITAEGYLDIVDAVKVVKRDWKDPSSRVGGHLYDYCGREKLEYTQTHEGDGIIIYANGDLQDCCKRVREFIAKTHMLDELQTSVDVKLGAVVVRFVGRPSCIVPSNLMERIGTGVGSGRDKAIKISTIKLRGSSLCSSVHSKVRVTCKDEELSAVIAKPDKSANLSLMLNMLKEHPDAIVFIGDDLVSGIYVTGNLELVTGTVVSHILHAGEIYNTFKALSLGDIEYDGVLSDNLQMRYKDGYNRIIVTVHNRLSYVQVRHNMITGSTDIELYSVEDKTEDGYVIVDDEGTKSSYKCDSSEVFNISERSSIVTVNMLNTNAKVRAFVDMIKSMKEGK